LHQQAILKDILRIISEDQNKDLNGKFTKTEVELAISLMQPDKAPRPYGFPAFFFQKCWHFIGDEIVDALEGVRNSGSLLKEVNNTFLSLIPKKEKPENLGDLQPISLCNTIYKILTKTLANRI